MAPAEVLGRAAFLTGAQLADVPLAPGELANLFGTG
jgi:hypothetical protein